MSLYVTGTVNMTNNSAAVVGVGTAFVANVTAGAGFLIQGETVYYTVLSITDDTHLTLSVVYAGTTGTGKTYQISRDWTTNLGLAEIQPGDPNWPYLLTQKVIRLLDAGVAPLASPVFSAQISTPKIVTASGNLEILPPGNADIVLQGSGTGKVGIGPGVPGYDLTLASGKNMACINGYFYGAGTGISQLLLNSAGTNLGTIQNDAADVWSLGTKTAVGTTLGTPILTWTKEGNVGIGTTSPTARLHLPAGSTVASTAPLKFTAGTNLTTPEIGAMEFVDNGTTGHLYITLNVAGVLTRVQIA